jgi:hypothetical protein
VLQHTECTFIMFVQSLLTTSASIKSTCSTQDAEVVLKMDPAKVLQHTECTFTFSVQSLLTTSAFIKSTCSTQDAEAVSKMDPAKVLQHMECTFVFAAVWSLGGTGAGISDREAFDTFFRHAVNGTLPEYVSPSGER